MSYGQEKFYGLLKQRLMDWVWNNPKLLHKITRRDLEHLFEFDPQRGLSIDLRRFNRDFYRITFYPPQEKKPHIDEFVRKVCGIIQLDKRFRQSRPDDHHYGAAHDLRDQSLEDFLYQREL